MTVIYIREAKARGYLRIGLSDEEKIEYTVSEADYRDADSPAVGDYLTRDALSLLKNADMRYKARMRALRILSLGDNSEKMLMLKLMRAGASHDIASEVVEEMVKLGYVNSQRQLERLIIYEVNEKLHGPRKLLPRLIAKGYSRDEVARVMNDLALDGEIDFEAAKMRLIEKHRLDIESDEEEIKKLLYKNGYSVC